MVTVALDEAQTELGVKEVMVGIAADTVKQ